MKNNDSYGINISFSANYTDKDASAKVNITDTDGLDVSSEQSGEMSAIDDVFADLFTDISDKVLNARAVSKQRDDNKKLRADFDQLKKDHQSLKIDNNVLKLRLEALQKAYDEAVNTNKKASAEKEPPLSSPYVVSDKSMSNYKVSCEPERLCCSEKSAKGAKLSCEAKKTAADVKAKAAPVEDRRTTATATGRSGSKSYINLSELSDYLDSLESLYKTFFK